MSIIKRAIFIAAGEGSRMRPVTLERPKPLVEVNGKRIIDSSIEALKKIGIHEIYIVVGYKKEKFYEAYADDPDIHIIENPYYLEGNNITSLYVAREYLPQSFVIEADILVQDPDIFNINIKKSGYMASWLKVPESEWSLFVENDRVKQCNRYGGDMAYRLWGISMWNKEDGMALAEEIREVFEEDKNWKIFWDEVALFRSLDKYDLGVKRIEATAVCEIDTIAELAQIDSSYKIYL